MVERADGVVVVPIEVEIMEVTNVLVALVKVAVVVKKEDLVVAVYVEGVEII